LGALKPVSRSINAIIRLNASPSGVNIGMLSRITSSRLDSATPVYRSSLVPISIPPLFARAKFAL
jgi:hypothetical protein